jgi:hypothetical protein
MMDIVVVLTVVHSSVDWSGRKRGSRCEGLILKWIEAFILEMGD